MSGGVLSSANDDDGGGFHARCASSSQKGRCERRESRADARRRSERRRSFLCERRRRRRIPRAMREELQKVASIIAVAGPPAEPPDVCRERTGRATGAQELHAGEYLGSKDEEQGDR